MEDFYNTPASAQQLTDSFAALYEEAADYDAAERRGRFEQQVFASTMLYFDV